MCCRGNEGGTWGIVVVVAAFCLQILAFGTAQSIGVYNIEFLRYFESGAAAVSLVGSINLGVFLGAGPLASILMARYGHRRVAIAGAVLTNIGLVCMPFAPSLPYMYIFYGVIAGLGNCLVYVPSHILSGMYFSKHRSLATGVATAGSGLGATVFPIMMHYVIDSYGWQGSLFIVAGLNLHLIVFAGLLRPVPKHLALRIAEEEKMLEGKSDKDADNVKADVVEMDDLNKANGNDNMDLEGNGKLYNENDTHDLDIIIERTPMFKTKNTNEVKSNNADTSDRFNNKFLSMVVEHFRSVFQFDFIVYWFNNVFWNAGVAIVWIFIAEYAVILGFEKDSASLLLTVQGAGSCIGCVLGGVLGNIKHFNRVGVYIVGNIGMGCLTCLITWQRLQTLTGLVVLMFVLGLMFGIILGLLVVVTADLLGIEALGHGFGYLMLANGIGVFAGPPLSGLLIDHYDRIEPAIYLSGVLTTVGGIVMCIVPLRQYFTTR